ncbi:MAG: DUF4286 family protein [Bacteroidia bacterium]
MIMYNVTVMVEEGIATTWLGWMNQHHIPDVMATGFFVSHRVCRLMEPAPEPGTTTYAIQYYCTDRKQLQAYLDQKAPALRQAHHEMFGERAQSFRTVLEILDPLNPSIG